MRILFTNRFARSVPPNTLQQCMPISRVIFKSNWHFCVVAMSSHVRSSLFFGWIAACKCLTRKTVFLCQDLMFPCPRLPAWRPAFTVKNTFYLNAIRVENKTKADVQCSELQIVWGFRLTHEPRISVEKRTRNISQQQHLLCSCSLTSHLWHELRFLHSHKSKNTLL